LISALGGAGRRNWVGAAGSCALACGRRTRKAFAAIPDPSDRRARPDRFIPKKGDQRAKGPLMHYAVAANGIGLAEAGLAGDARGAGAHHRLVAGPGGGARSRGSMSRSSAASSGPEPRALLNERAAQRSAADVVPAQLRSPNSSSTAHRIDASDPS